MASMLHLFLLLGSLMVASADSFYRDFEITWGDGRAKILNNGQLLTLSLDRASGSGFQSKNEYLYGKIDMQLKLVPGNSAGTVTAYYPDSHITHVSWVGTMCHIPLVKTDWTRAPFTASYRNFKANACVWSKGKSSCASNSASSRSKSNAWFSQQLDSTSQNRLNWVKKNYMIYNYCTDTKRFPQGLPVECRTV